ncbi:MAG: N-acetylglucosamine-6-phosphate deacetylase [Treponema sp.]|jgi:N-acetylglucosamine-6-phosphate deacetylase|nr:N-acetylglucosamine-6-phosphate deacetylase [Treponema sp.]
MGSDSILFQNVRLALPGGLTPGDMLISGGIITGINTAADTAARGDGSGENGTGAAENGRGGNTAADKGAGTTFGALLVNGKGRILAPGFIDLHCHGGAGGDLGDGERGAFFVMEEFHRSHGITAFMPSLSTDPMPKLERACSVIRQIMRETHEDRAEILGIHFESPYISPKYRGCQAAEHLLPFDRRAMEFIEKNRDIITRITAAPELEGVLDAIPRIREMGIIFSGGHTDADAATFREAADRGMSMVTHLFNAMSSVRKEGPFRIPGALEAALTDDRLFTECIADGWHVPAELLQMAWRCKGRDRFMLCSDASRAAGYSGSGPLFICGQEAIVEHGVAMVKDRSSLASSAVALDSMVRFLVKKAGFPLVAALEAASRVPAMAAGVEGRKGRLETGYDADLVLLNDELEVLRVWRGGREIFNVQHG